jgi:DNA recombination-dependent growth factor C
VLTQVVGGGVRSVGQFLELSGLWQVVAAGDGTPQQTVQAIEEAIITFGREEKKTLAAKMPRQSIPGAQDETFHDKPCLVAIEPVSNFILVEDQAQDRRAETWNAALKRGLEDLPVEVGQTTSDEGAALLSHTKNLEAHHSLD